MKNSILLFLGIFLAGGLRAQDGSSGTKGAKPESSYTFTSSMTYKLTSTNRKGKSTWMTNQYFFSEQGTAVGMKFVESSEGGKPAGGIDFIILDIGQGRMFTFMESKIMMGIALRQDKLNETLEKENSAIHVTKTDETRTIMGQVCDGYLVENEKDKSKVTMWVSRNKVEALANLGTQMARAFNGNGKQTNYFAYNAHPELVKMVRQGRGVMGYTTQSEKGDITEMELVETAPRISYVFKASDYKSLF